MEDFAAVLLIVAMLVIIVLSFYVGDIIRLFRERSENKLEIERERTRQAELNAQNRANRMM